MADNPAAKIFTHKWLNNECIESGCQSLVLAEAITWIRVVGEELVIAGGKRGTRDITLANLRALIAERDKFREALKRVADPEDDCHCGASGPWNDVASDALGFIVNDGSDWYEEGRNERLTVDEMIERHPK